MQREAPRCGCRHSKPGREPGDSAKTPSGGRKTCSTDHHTGLTSNHFSSADNTRLKHSPTQHNTQPWTVVMEKTGQKHFFSTWTWAGEGAEHSQHPSQIGFLCLPLNPSVRKESGGKDFCWTGEKRRKASFSRNKHGGSGEKTTFQDKSMKGKNRFPASAGLEFLHRTGEVAFPNSFKHKLNSVWTDSISKHGLAERI